ncbi:MAG TPA: cupredoxin domain-containing protein [Stellaceae bacterium]|nr:cupredoxin domain-containing protein [Stellaceae bacterium]
MPKLSPVLLVAALLLGAAPAGARAADWSKAQKITVATVEYAFRPADLTFHAGKPYRLHLENKGKETHEFTAPDFFKTLDMRNPDMTGPDRQEIVLQPGDKKDFYFVAKQAGSFDLRCSDHDWAGMVGHITVTK